MPAFDAWLMPTTPNRTKKALQELARVFNKLASELTADLNSAVKEIENLRKEVQRIKSSRGGVNKGTSTSKKSSSSKAKSNPAVRTSVSRNTSHTGTNSHAGSSHGTSKPSHEGSSFVFPQEPFNPTPPPEPTPPGNN